MNLHGIISKVKSNITRAVLSPAVLSGEPQPLHAYNRWVKEVILVIEEQENPKSSLPFVLATSSNSSILIALLDFEN